MTRSSGQLFWMVVRPCLRREREVLAIMLGPKLICLPCRPSNIILTSFCVAWTANVWLRKRYPRFFTNFIYVIRSVAIAFRIRARLRINTSTVCF